MLRQSNPNVVEVVNIAVMVTPWMELFQLGHFFLPESLGIAFHFTQL
jgi:hypothetical protein